MTCKTHHPLYTVWKGIKRRCLNPKARYWENYGGRGIKICDAWLDFYQFANDVGPKPSPSHSIDRIDNDGDYRPGNVRWATKSEQMLNRRNAVFVEIEGVRYRAFDLAKRSGRKSDTIVYRASQGMNLEQVLADGNHVPRRCIEAANAGRTAKAKARTHCVNGHPWSVKNTYFTKDGAKTCRVCRATRMRERNAAKRALKKPPL